jgi:hypothetical protein
LLPHVSQGSEIYEFCVKIQWTSLDLIEFDVDYMDYSSEMNKVNIPWQVEM